MWYCFNRFYFKNVLGPSQDSLEKGLGSLSYRVKTYSWTKQQNEEQVLEILK